jgi:hypothetical protein
VKANGEHLNQHVHPIIIYAEICVFVSGGEVDEFEGEKVEDALDVEQVLKGEDVDRHQHDVEVCH